MLLVGVIGKYEYMDYVKRIGHNKEIEFNCDKGYKRIGNNVLHELNRTLNTGKGKILHCKLKEPTWNVRAFRVASRTKYR